MSPELQAFAADLLDELCRSHPIGYRPALIWKRLRVSAGMAYYTKGTIALSLVVLASEDQVRSTLIHEYAHLMAVKRGGVKAAGHGPAWQEAMRDLGQKPVVRHTYQVQRNQPRQSVVYLCQKCGSEIVRSRRLPRRRTYIHRDCGGKVRLLAVRERAG